MRVAVGIMLDENTTKRERGLARHRAMRTLLDRIDATPHPERLWSLLREFARGRGYDRLVVVDAGKLAHGAQRTLVHANPEALGRALVEAYRVVDAAAIREALIAPEPFLVSELLADDRRANAGWIKAIAHGMRNNYVGLVVPIHDPAGEPIAAAIFTGKESDTSAIARAELYVVAHAAFNRYLVSVAEATQALGRTLSNREIDCLRLTSIGKSDEEIGETLKISARTVRFHIDAAKAKLGANNRVTAVAMALREKLIALLAAVALATTATATASSAKPAIDIFQFIC